MEEEKAAADPSPPPPPRRVVGEYELREMVGKGTFAEVFRAVHAPTGARVAVKEIDRRRVDDYVRRGILQEVTILGGLSHPNILRLVDAVEVNNQTSPPPESPPKFLKMLTPADGGEAVPGAGVLRRRRPRGVQAGARRAAQPVAGGHREGLRPAARYVPH